MHGVFNHTFSAHSDRRHQHHQAAAANDRGGCVVAAPPTVEDDGTFFLDTLRAVIRLDPLSRLRSQTSRPQLSQFESGGVDDSDVSIAFTVELFDTVEEEQERERTSPAATSPLVTIEFLTADFTDHRRGSGATDGAFSMPPDVASGLVSQIRNGFDTFWFKYHSARWDEEQRRLHAAQQLAIAAAQRPSVSSLPPAIAAALNVALPHQYSSPDRSTSASPVPPLSHRMSLFSWSIVVPDGADRQSRTYEASPTELTTSHGGGGGSRRPSGMPPLFALMARRKSSVQRVAAHHVPGRTDSQLAASIGNHSSTAMAASQGSVRYTPPGGAAAVSQSFRSIAYDAFTQQHAEDATTSSSLLSGSASSHQLAQHRRVSSVRLPDNKVRLVTEVVGRISLASEAGANAVHLQAIASRETAVAVPPKPLPAPQQLTGSDIASRARRGTITLSNVPEAKSVAAEAAAHMAAAIRRGDTAIPLLAAKKGTAAVPFTVPVSLAAAGKAAPSLRAHRSEDPARNELDLSGSAQRPVFHLHLGTSAMKRGLVLWDKYCVEHAVFNDLRAVQGRTDVLFRHVHRGRSFGQIVPRALFVDFDISFSQWEDFSSLIADRSSRLPNSQCVLDATKVFHAVGSGDEEGGRHRRRAWGNPQRPIWAGSIVSDGDHADGDPFSQHGVALEYEHVVEAILSRLREEALRCATKEGADGLDLVIDASLDGATGGGLLSAVLRRLRGEEEASSSDSKRRHADEGDDDTANSWIKHITVNAQLPSRRLFQAGGRRGSALQWASTGDRNAPKPSDAWIPSNQIDSCTPALARRNAAVSWQTATALADVVIVSDIDSMRRFQASSGASALRFAPPTHASHTAALGMNVPPLVWRRCAWEGCGDLGAGGSSRRPPLFGDRGPAASLFGQPYPQQWSEVCADWYRTNLAWATMMAQLTTCARFGDPEMDVVRNVHAACWEPLRDSSSRARSSRRALVVAPRLAFVSEDDAAMWAGDSNDISPSIHSDLVPRDTLRMAVNELLSAQSAKGERCPFSFFEEEAYQLGPSSASVAASTLLINGCSHVEALASLGGMDCSGVGLYSHHRLRAVTTCAAAEPQHGDDDVQVLAISAMDDATCAAVDRTLRSARGGVATDNAHRGAFEHWMKKR